MATRNTIRVPFGTFEVSGGRLLVTDPCYEVGADGSCRPGLQAIVERCEDGLWGAEGEAQGGRVFALAVRLVAPPRAGRWERADAEDGACVDSGQLGVFDAGRFPRGPKEDDPGDGASFYGRCCKLTLGPTGGGVTGEGAVSSSGWGDGSYPVWAWRGRDGVCRAVRVDFDPEVVSEEGGGVEYREPGDD